jgi:hypothetical protein
MDFKKENFLNKIELIPFTDCWAWTGAANENGYGQFKINNSKNQVIASRASYFLFKGQIAEDLCVCHKCDNPWCVNPNHLFLATHQENMIDKKIKGRAKHKIGRKKAIYKKSRKRRLEDFL